MSAPPIHITFLDGGARRTKRPKSTLASVQPLEFGEGAGHAFRGNQHTGGIDGDGTKDMRERPGAAARSRDVRLLPTTGVPGDVAAAIAEVLPTVTSVDLTNMDPVLALRLQNSITAFTRDYPAAAASLRDIVVTPLDSNVVAQTVRGMSMGDWGSDLKFNSLYYGAGRGAETAREVMSRDVDIGFHLYDPATGAMEHELGHVLSNYAEREIGEELGTGAVIAAAGGEDAMTDSSITALTDGLGEYAKASPGEAFAEAFAQDRLGVDNLSAEMQRVVDETNDAVRNAAVRASGWRVPETNAPTCKGFISPETLARIEAITAGLVEFGEAQGHAFRGNQYTGGIEGDAVGPVSSHVRREGGMTYNPRTDKEPVDGYIVAKAGIPSTFIRPAEKFLADEAGAKAALRAFIVLHAEEYNDPEAMVGIWYDRKNHEVVLDVVERVAEEGEAVQAGRERNQQAVWDVVNKREIPTGGTGDR